MKDQPDLTQTPNACLTSTKPAYSSQMKAELLDIDAILSHATAELSMPSPDLARARAKIKEARLMILNLLEGLEEVEKTAKN